MISDEARDTSNPQERGRNVPSAIAERNINATKHMTGIKMNPPQVERRRKMTTMNASMWMDKVGMTLINAALLAGFPAAMVAILIQSF